MQHLLVNFGGPRSLKEIPEFLSALLSDQEVLKTPLPSFLHKIIFRRIAKRRAKDIAKDYALIGGKSPIYEDTENLATLFEEEMGEPFWTFHRYLPKTHPTVLEKLEKSREKEILVFPLFPQFSYTTTGSVARFFSRNLSPKTCSKLRWIPSYPKEKGFVIAYQEKILRFCAEKKLKKTDVLLLFSAHGIPERYVRAKDPYQKECILSYEAIMQGLPGFFSRLSYQSKFGPGKWLTPYTEESCKSILSWNQGRNHVLVIPISFTSDHIETLFEIEELYLPILRENGVQAHRLDALNLEKTWIDGAISIMRSSPTKKNSTLLRKPCISCKKCGPLPSYKNASFLKD